jgi:hypothetical protein
MIAIAMILAGALIAAVLDWAIYTHLSAYFRAGFRLDRHLSFNELLRTRWQRARFALVITAGILAGVSFAAQLPTLWILAMAVFLVGHGFAYMHIFKR